jgi:predicted aspartyl protease
MPNYDAAHYDPPAPVAQVTLREMTNGTLLANVTLLLDTGADITLLPRGAVERLGVKPLGGVDYELVTISKASADADGDTKAARSTVG